MNRCSPDASCPQNWRDRSYSRLRPLLTRIPGLGGWLRPREPFPHPLALILMVRFERLGFRDTKSFYESHKNRAEDPFYLFPHKSRVLPDTQ